MVALALSASSIRLMPFSPSPQACRFSRSRHDQPGELHRRVGTGLRVTRGAGPSRPCKSLELTLACRQERSGQLLATPARLEVASSWPDLTFASAARMRDRGGSTS